MCGLTGFIEFGDSVYDLDSVSRSMVNEIVHRGPDDVNVWTDDVCPVSLGHARLSILDLSSAGSQPMSSNSKRFIIAFNGEIYNHLEVRGLLLKSGVEVKWRGHSDTETLLAGFEYWGIEKTLEKSVGMFSFSLWDRELKTLTLGRDRLGEKPLYYGWQDDTFLFGSELKALKMHPSFKSEINRNSLALFVRHNCIPSPHCIWGGIQKLEPGCCLKISMECRELVVSSYWSLKDSVESSVELPSAGEEYIVKDLESLLRSSVKEQMLSTDVPIGAFLSGGVDSSVIVALMQAQSEVPVKTFSIGFQDDLYDESKYARDVAEHLGVDHTELIVTPEMALGVIKDLPEIYDEPFADSSQIPTYLVCKLARKHVTVSLSGDGGDEIFCGYNRYTIVRHTWGKLRLIPRFIRMGVAKTLVLMPPKKWNKFSKIINAFLPERLRLANLGEKIHKGAKVLASNSIDELYLGLVSQWDSPEDLVLGSREPKTVLTSENLQPDLSCDVGKMMAMDMLSYLPDDILTKVDRAAMHVSLETRVPFLNHKIVEYAMKIPLKLKVKDGVGKWILREVLYKYVPKNLMERPKMGFGVPIGTWLRGPLKSWAEELICEDRLKREGYFDASMVREKWMEHQTGKRNWQHLLWCVLMFQTWKNEQENV